MMTTRGKACRDVVILFAVFLSLMFVLRPQMGIMKVTWSNSEEGYVLETIAAKMQMAKCLEIKKGYDNHATHDYHGEEEESFNTSIGPPGTWVRTLTCKEL